MLFIHGGGFEFSSGGADIYNGEALSSKGDVIVVTINYRLGNIVYYSLMIYQRFVRTLNLSHKLENLCLIIYSQYTKAVILFPQVLKNSFHLNVCCFD
jgi:hypothetical protein